MTTAEKLTQVAENVSKVYEAGKKSEYDKFWDAYQQNGERSNYCYAFAGEGWADDVFKPKYDIYLNEGIFRSSSITDLTQLLSDCGIKLNNDTPRSINYSFKDASLLTRVPPIYTRSDITYAFHNCTSLKTIDEFRVNFKGYGTDAIYAQNFQNCTSLENLTIVDCEIQRTSLNLQWSPLTAESGISVLTHLKDLSQTEDAFIYTVTLSPTTWELLDAQGNASPNGNTWREYAIGLGWAI